MNIVNNNVSTHSLTVNNFKMCVSYSLSGVGFSPSVTKPDAVVFDVGENTFVASKMY